jgi:hypothetical protein
MLAEVEANFITTAELEMQAAPRSAAAIGVPVLPGTAASSSCHYQNCVMVMTLACAVLRSQHGFRS